MCSNGVRFVKNEESLPQSAHGLRYGVGLGREMNVGGNHFIGADAGFDGVHYWDNQAYNDNILEIQKQSLDLKKQKILFFLLVKIL